MSRSLDRQESSVSFQYIIHLLNSLNFVGTNRRLRYQRRNWDVTLPYVTVQISQLHCYAR